MKDRKGKELSVGDRVYVTKTAGGRLGRLCFVRDIDSAGEARVDDGKMEGGNKFGWGAWVDSSRIEKL